MKNQEVAGKYVGVSLESQKVRVVKVVDVDANGNLTLERIGGPSDGDRFTTFQPDGVDGFHFFDTYQDAYHDGQIDGAV